MSSKVIVVDVLTVGNETFVSTAKGGYNSLEVAYKDNGKVSGKKLVDFTNKDLYAQVKAFKQGDKVEVSLEKEQGSDGREYWQWKQVRVLGGEEAAVGQGNSVTGSTREAPTSARSTGKVVGSNYETPEERALKQVLIVRQSCLEQANKFLAVEQGQYEVKDLTSLAGKLFNWVFENGRLTPPALNVPAKVEVAEEVYPVLGEAPKRRGRPAAVKQVGPDDLDSDIPF